MNNYLKDSSNNYVIYLDQGTDYELVISLTSLGITDNTNYTFTGTVWEHSSSKKQYDIEVTKPSTTSISLFFRNYMTAELKKTRYQFEVISVQSETTVKRLIQGSVIVTPTHI